MKNRIYSAIVFVVLLLVGISASCTEQIRAKGYGGETVIELKCDQKLEMMTWKGNDIWIQTRPFRKGEYVEIHSFSENSSFGIFEGTISVVEHRCKL